MIDFTKNVPRRGVRSPLAAHRPAHRPANSSSHPRALLSSLPLGALAFLLFCAGIGTALFYFFGNESALGALPLWASAVAGLSFLVMLFAAVTTGRASFLMNVLMVAALPLALRILSELLDAAGDTGTAERFVHGLVSTCVQWGVAALVTFMAFMVFAGPGTTADEDLPDAD